MVNKYMNVHIKIHKKMEVINMAKICEVFQEADWKSEKHVPVIEAPETVRKDEPMNIKVIVGK